jgi:CRP/FNR family cyclic AMP-dependent transcriptional regulator
MMRGEPSVWTQEHTMRAEDTNLLSDHLLSRLSARGDVRTYARGEVLIHEGEVSDALYVLLSGELKVYTTDAREREFVYNVIGPGEFFGELFLDGGLRSASVKAVTTSLCVAVGREALRGFMNSYPEFAERLVLKLIGRVRHATEQTRTLAFDGARDRTVTVLNSLIEEQDGERMIRDGVTQQDIADRIGATREMVNYVLRDLLRSGHLVRRADKRLVVARNLGERDAL